MTLRLRIEHCDKDSGRVITIKRGGGREIVVQPGQTEEIYVWQGDNGSLKIEEPAEQPAPETKRGL